MHKRIIIALTLMMFAMNTLAQENERRITISAEPLKAAFGSLNALYQHKLTNYVALTVPVFFGTNLMVPAIMNMAKLLTNEDYTSGLLFGGGGIGARFYFNGNGMTDGFFAEPRVTLGYSRFFLKKEEGFLIDSRRLTITPTAVAGYSWFFNNGFFVSAGLAIGMGFHAKNDISIDDDFKNRMKERAFTRNRLWADEGRFRLDYAGDFSIGYSF